MVLSNVANAVKHMDLDRLTKRILSVVHGKKRIREKKSTVAKEMIHSISCPGIAGQMIGFRQCADLIKVQQEMKCTIRIVSNGKSAEANSMLGLLQLQIQKGSLVILTIRDGDMKGALKRCAEIMEFREEH